MQINAADTDGLFELTRSTGRDTEADLLSTQVRHVHVLEAIEQSDELRDQPVISLSEPRDLERYKNKDQ